MEERKDEEELREMRAIQANDSSSLPGRLFAPFKMGGEVVVVVAASGVAGGGPLWVGFPI